MRQALEAKVRYFVARIHESGRKGVALIADWIKTRSSNNRRRETLNTLGT